MSWVNENTKCSWLQRMCFHVLKCCVVPKHIGIIMDGNRRFAKQNSVERSEGHRRGFDKLTEMLQWCKDMGVEEVTVFAFSIENFKRDKDEVSALMDLAKEKFKLLIKEWKKLREHGICVRIIGNLSRLPEDLVLLMIVTMLLTRHNTKAYLNIAFSYMGKEEMLYASDAVVRDHRSAFKTGNDISHTSFSNYLYTFDHPDVIVRTSGQIRLSDFLTWQSAYSFYDFVNILWPDISAWHLIWTIFRYQHFYRKLQSNKATIDIYCCNADENASLDEERRLKCIIDRENFSPMSTEVASTLFAYFDDDRPYSCQQLYDYYQQNENLILSLSSS